MSFLAFFNFTHITTNTTTVVRAGPGILHSVIVNTTAAGAITLYDGPPVAANVIAILKASIAEGTYYYDVAIKTALYVVTAAASDVTVTWG